MSMNWDDLKVLLAVGRGGSLSRAAMMLGIDQSTAGRRLTAIEAELGVTLFVRSKTGFTPTDAGNRAIARAIEVEQRIERLAEEATVPEAGPSGVVRLLGNNWVLNRLAQTTLTPFARANPNLVIRLVTRPPLVHVRSDATLSLWFETPPRPEEFAIKLGDVPYSAYAAKDLDLDEAGWVSFFDEDAPRRAPVRTWEKARKRGETLRATASDAGVLMTTVQAGLGKGFLPMCIAQEAPGLRQLDVEPRQLNRPLNLHVHPDTVQSLRIQATIRWLRESFATVFVPGPESS